MESSQGEEAKGAIPWSHRSHATGVTLEQLFLNGLEILQYLVDGRIALTQIVGTGLAYDPIDLKQECVIRPMTDIGREARERFDRKTGAHFRQCLDGLCDL